MDYRFIPTTQIAQHIEGIIQNESRKRKAFERRWYNNNFFDDGYHYRFVSRTTGRVVDLSTTSDSFIPYRAIPKASRQIRGVANLLLANEPTPVVYPEKISTTQYMNNPQAYQQALDNAKIVAKRSGQWIEHMWKHMSMKEKLTLMVILTAKHGVSYMQLWPDAANQDITATVYDAFDIYVRSNLYSIYDSPYIIKVAQKTLAEIRANQDFDPEQIDKLNPDNKYATSEIKEAYMLSRFGQQTPDEKSATVLLKEGFLKEYISDENIEQVKADLGPDFKDKKVGDVVIRQIFECAGVWLKDTYMNLAEYPFIDYRMEPGPIYQVPFIERFIPANKSLDSVMSRIERHIGTMAVGAWFKRRGENYTISNMSGGQMIEYDTTPPVQAQVASLPSELFAYIGQLNQVIEEQGATTSALGQTQPGVKSGIAIESLKASEYANLKIATDQLKKTVQTISERMLDYAAEYITSPATVYRLQDGGPDYFDVIGERGLSKYQALAKKKGSVTGVPNAIPLKKDYRVEIEIESGLGYTEQGKRDTMLQIIQWMTQMAQAGYITQDALGVVINRFLDIFQFGATGEFLDAMQSGNKPLPQQQLTQMKMAVLSALKDAGEIGQEASQKRVMENKFGTLQALKESGLADKISQQAQAKPPSESINYKDAPEDVKRQMEAAAGLTPSQTISPSGTEQLKKHIDLLKGGQNGNSQPEAAGGVSNGGQGQVSNTG